MSVTVLNNSAGFDEGYAGADRTFQRIMEFAKHQQSQAVGIALHRSQMAMEEMKSNQEFINEGLASQDEKTRTATVARVTGLQTKIYGELGPTASILKNMYLSPDNTKKTTIGDTLKESDTSEFYFKTPGAGIGLSGVNNSGDSGVITSNFQPASAPTMVNANQMKVQDMMGRFSNEANIA